MRTIGHVGPLLALALAACATAPTGERAIQPNAEYEAWLAANPDIEVRLHRVVADTRALIAVPASRSDALDTSPEIFRVRDTGLPVWDCASCPELIVTPAGSYVIGSSDGETGRALDEGPRKRIHLEYALAVARFEITRDQYEAFVVATNRPVAVGCQTDRDAHGRWANDSASTFRDPAFPQTGDHPVACVSWEDAQAYVAWLSVQTGRQYRLLTESEWEFLARAGAVTAFPWGEDADAGCADANGADVLMGSEYPEGYTAGDILTCNDGALKTAPVGAYRANAFGLHDMIGNLAEWVEDCSARSYEALPVNGAAYVETPCATRIVRGGAWGSQRLHLRVADRFRYAPGQHDDSVGIRVARTLD